MANLIENFPGAANQTQCFLHILNLTAKSILQQFEVPKKKETGSDEGDGGERVLNKAMKELLALADEIEDDTYGVDDKDDDEEIDFEDNEEGLEDERQELSGEEIAELEADLIPVRLMLTKV